MHSALLFATAIGAGSPTPGPDPFPYDHQTQTYVADIPTYSTDSTEPVTVTPYFSPDWPANVTVALIDSATHSIDIEIPSFASWSGCTPFTDPPACTAACSAADVMKEKFPVVPALLNAMHLRGVKVRIMTNDFGTPDCADTFSPLTLLALNGAQVKWHNQVTFMHAKYIAVDGARASISSINFSQTSFTKNREAGAVITGGCGPGGGGGGGGRGGKRACDDSLVAHIATAFNRDFARGVPAVPGTYSPADLAIVTDPSELPVNVPGPPTPPAHTPPYFVTPRPAPLTTAASSLSLHASPDFAYTTLMAQLAATTKSFDLMIYQITSDALCDRMLAMAADPAIALRLFVSSRIFGDDDCANAKKCYQRLWDAKVPVHMTTLHYTFSHQKFWIRDGDMVTWSTGNWSPSDFPAPPADTPPSGVMKLPPYGQPGWVKANRDYTITMKDAALAVPFQQVFDNDWAVGYDINLDTNFTISCGF